MNKFGKSQAYQDRFAYEICGTDSTYIEIGGYAPRHKNNTWALDKFYNWKGFTLELNTDWKDEWKSIRPNSKIYFENAITFDYLSAVKENSLPLEIGYLQADIEPPNNTFEALKKVIESGISFKCITFEHDKYQHDEDFDIIAREYLQSKGYKVAVYDVMSRKKKEPHIWNPFETWFVNHNIDFTSMSWFDWLKKHNIKV